MSLTTAVTLLPYGPDNGDTEVLYPELDDDIFINVQVKEPFMFDTIERQGFTVSKIKVVNIFLL